MLSAAELVALQNQLTTARIEQWQHEVLFTPQWWLLVFLTFTPWVIWVKFVDKKRILEISLFGVIIVGVISLLDALGMELGLWGYRYNLIPFYSGLLPMNISVLGVLGMFLYQLFRPWKVFLISTTILCCLLTFVGEPFMEYLGIYQMYRWQHWYSLPIYIVKPIIIRLIVTMLMKFGQKG